MIITFTSPDGTTVACDRDGAGPPLVLVHGTSADRHRWAPVRAALAAAHTVYALDRRGRGDSGDATPYAMEREFEDVAAVVDGIGGPVDLLGHSYGAICSLEAATRARHLRRLVLYEPPIATGAPIAADGLVERLEALLAAGDRDGVVTTFLREAPRVPPEQLVLLRSLPAWARRVAAAHTLPREVHASRAYTIDVSRLAAITAPTLLLLGGASPPFFAAALDAVQPALRDARRVVLPGQQHAAMDTAPDLFAREVLAFLG